MVLLSYALVKLQHGHQTSFLKHAICPSQVSCQKHNTYSGVHITLHGSLVQATELKEVNSGISVVWSV